MIPEACDMYNISRLNSTKITSVSLTVQLNKMFRPSIVVCSLFITFQQV